MKRRIIGVAKNMARRVHWVAVKIPEIGVLTGNCRIGLLITI